MSQKLIDTAARNLHLCDIFIKKSFANFIGEFIDVDDDVEIQQQGYSETVSCTAEQIGSDDAPTYSYTYKYRTGLRVVDNSLEKDDDNFSKVVMRADYEVVYFSSMLLEEDCMELFGRVNVGLHVWPFWREFVHSSCMKAGVDRIVLPFYTASLYGSKAEPGDVDGLVVQAQTH